MRKIVVFCTLAISLFYLTNSQAQTIQIQAVDSLNDLYWAYKDKDAKLALSYTRQAYRLANEINYLKGLAYSLMGIGVSHKHLHQYDHAIDTMSASLKIRYEMKDSLLIASGYINIGHIYALKEAHERAMAYYDSSLLFLANQNKSYQKQRAMAYNSIGVTAKNMGNYSKALENFDQSLQIKKALQDELGIAMSQMSLGTMYQKLGKWQKATESYNSALETFEQKNANRLIADLHFNKGGVALSKGELIRAEMEFKKCQEICHTYHFTHRQDDLDNNFGLIYRLQKKYDKAESFFRKSLERRESLQQQKAVLEAKVNLAMLSQDRGQYRIAEKQYRECLKLAKEMNAPLTKLNINNRLSQVAAQLGDFGTAYQLRERYDTLLNGYITDLKKVGNLEQELQEEQFQRSLLLKENALKIQQLENAELSSRNKTIVIGALALLLLGIAYGLWSWQRAKTLKYQKALAERDSQLKQEKVEILLKEKEVEALSSMIEGEENERERIARDLHDRLGSLLSVTIMQFKTLEEHLPDELVKKESVDQVNTLLQETCDEVRRIAKNMSSGFLTRFGLKPALNKLVQTLNDTDQIKANLILHGIEERFGVNFEIDVYRVIQELTGNALKHAGADELELQLVRNSDSLNIMIEDNGQGFDTSHPDSKEGMGLKNVEARIKRLQGNYNIDSVLGRGTIISIDLPV